MADPSPGCSGGEGRQDELSPDARRALDFWRSLGLSEAAAFELVRQDGQSALESDPDPGRVELFRSMGLSESAAVQAAAELPARRRPEPDIDLPARDEVPAGERSFHVVVEMCQRRGLNNRQALTEAVRHEKDHGRQAPQWAVDLLEGREPTLLQEGATGMPGPAEAETYRRFLREAEAAGLEGKAAVRRAVAKLDEHRRKRGRGKPAPKASELVEGSVPLTEDRAVALFRRLGLSEEAAQAAAKGAN